MKQLLTLTFLFLFGIVHAQIPSYIPSNGLVGWWPFNGNANDESGNGHDLILSGDAATVNDRYNQQNRAYFFTNVANNSRLEFSPADYNIIDNLNSGTVTFWLKLNSFDVSNHYFGFDNMFMIRQKHGQSSQFLIGINSGSSKIRFHLNGPLPYLNDLVSATSLNLGQWYHVTYVWNGTQEKVYLNGIIDNVMNSTNNISSINTPDMFCFGSYDGIGSISTNSALDDIGIWNRALTEAEILALYEGCQLAITTQPQDQSVTTSVGTASFTVASSSANATYQWQTNLGLGYQNISNAGQYSGATSASLSVSNLSMANDNQVFRCIVNDGSCADTTAEATLTIIDDAGIQNITVSSIKLYPNPVQDVLYIDGLAGKEFEYEVLSIEGKLLQKGKSQGEIAVKELKKGNYVLRIGQQQVAFVKQ